MSLTSALKNKTSLAKFRFDRAENELYDIERLIFLSSLTGQHRGELAPTQVEYINTIDPAKSDPEIAWRYVQPSSEYRRLKVEVSSAVCRPSDVVLPCAKNRDIVFKFQRFEKIFQESCAAIFHSSSHFEYFNFQKIIFTFF